MATACVTSVKAVLWTAGAILDPKSVNKSIGVSPLTKVSPQATPVLATCQPTGITDCAHSPARPMVIRAAAPSANRIGGFIAWGPEGGRSWELRYLTRRLLAPREEPPHMGSLLGWGATTIAFNPRTTADQRAMVNRIEMMGERLGVDRRSCRALSTAAHELTMNAMYDAPVDAEGRLKYAMDRTAELTLEPHEVPTLRFTLSAEFIALDIIDPFGRLARQRYYEAVLRGHRNVKYERLELDTSHGGAGLGLHTLYSSGSIVRAELQPNHLTHVSWVLDRDAEVQGFQDLPRSLYFLPYLPDAAPR